MKNPRQIAAEALIQVERRGAWSNLALDSILRKYELNGRDSAFISALFYGVIERLLTLDACIARHSKQPPDKLDPAVRAVLRLGIYQLLYLDSVPEHAAVGESVELVKKLRKAQASGYVNGVLRAFLRAGKTVPLPPEPLSANWSVLYSCPQELVELWLAGYGEEATQRLLVNSLGRPSLYLRANTLLISPEELISRLSAHGIAAEPTPGLPNCLAVKDAGAVQKLPEYRRGFFHVQDISSQLCAQALEAPPGARVLDACSAPGGKAFTLFQQMEGRGEIIAADLHEHRAKLISERAKQMKLSGISAVAADMSVFTPTLGLFDRVLCDVPCSGFGVIRRKPEIKYKPLSEVENLPGIQYKILETASQYCQVGGLLLYSTCTLNPAENSAVAQRFLQEHPGFSPSPLSAPLGPAYERTLLGEFDADGFYLARFRRER